MISIKNFLIAYLIGSGREQSRRQRIRRYRSTLYCLCWLQVLTCCTTSSSTPSPSLPGQKGAETGQAGGYSKSGDPLNSGFFNGAPDEEKEAWILFTKSNRYRAARADDFQLPETAMKARTSDLDKATKHPYVGGDINRDGAYNDFAVIVTDMSRSDKRRYGLVIFTQPTDIKGQYEKHWLYQDRDLSKTVLEWWSGGLALREYFEDGTDQYCYVNWDRQAKVFSCDKEYKQ